MRSLILALTAATVTACSSATFEAPPGCRFSSENATELAASYLASNGLSWGNPTRVSFDGSTFRIQYETPDGEDPRSLLVDCNSGAVSRG